MARPPASASNANPCPVCRGAGKDRCAVGDRLVWCRAPAGKFAHGPNAAPGWRYDGEKDGAHVYKPARDAGPAPQSPAAEPRTRDWHAEAMGYALNITAKGKDHAAALASELGLPRDFLLKVYPLLGFAAEDPNRAGRGPAWTFPSCNAAEAVIGISLRHTRTDLENRKLEIRGGNRGLFLPHGWRDRPGPLFIAEGQTDAVALAWAGLCGIGRPHNSGWKYLPELLAGWPTDRGIVVLGENDRKDNGDWPGRTGAESVARKLADALGRDVSVAFPPGPPDGAGDLKDARDYLTHHDHDDKTPAARGIELAEHFATTELVVRPSPPAPAPAATAGEPQKKAVRQFKFRTLAELARDYVPPAYLIPGILAAGEPAVIAGPAKGLKTTLGVNLGLTLAAGVPFLNKWYAPKRWRVVYASGESGEATVLETARRMCAAAGVDVAAVDGLRFTFDLPRLTDPEDLGAFADAAAAQAEGAAAGGFDVLFIDPLYLSLGADVEHTNVFAMGNALRLTAEALGGNGRTLVILHHANRKSPDPFAPMELSNLAYAGVGEFSRQWLLVNRRESYAADGRHALWLTVGGSAGHGGRFGVNVDEGQSDGVGGGRTWDVEVIAAADLAESEAEGRQTAESRKKIERLKADAAFVLDHIRELATDANPVTTTALRDLPEMISKDRLGKSIQRLLGDGRIRQVDFDKPGGNGSKQHVVGYVAAAESANGGNGGPPTVLDYRSANGGNGGPPTVLDRGPRNGGTVGVSGALFQSAPEPTAVPTPRPPSAGGEKGDAVGPPFGGTSKGTKTGPPSPGRKRRPPEVEL